MTSRCGLPGCSYTKQLQMIAFLYECLIRVWYYACHYIHHFIYQVQLKVYYLHLVHQGKVTFAVQLKARTIPHTCFELVDYTEACEFLGQGQWKYCQCKSKVTANIYANVWLSHSTSFPLWRVACSDCCFYCCFLDVSHIVSDISHICVYIYI